MEAMSDYAWTSRQTNSLKGEWYHIGDLASVLGVSLPSAHRLLRASPSASASARRLVRRWQDPVTHRWYSRPFLIVPAQTVIDLHAARVERMLSRVRRTVARLRLQPPPR